MIDGSEKKWLWNKWRTYYPRFNSGELWDFKGGIIHQNEINQFTADYAIALGTQFFIPQTALGTTGNL